MTTVQTSPAGTTAHGLPRYLVAAVLEGARVVLVLLALDRTGSAAVGGLLVAALLAPHVVAAPAVGWLTDRARVLSLMIAPRDLLLRGIAKLQQVPQPL